MKKKTIIMLEPQGIMSIEVCVQILKGNGSYFRLLGGKWNTSIWVCFDRGYTDKGFDSYMNVGILSVGIPL